MVRLLQLTVSNIEYDSNSITLTLPNIKLEYYFVGKQDRNRKRRSSHEYNIYYIIFSQDWVYGLLLGISKLIKVKAISMDSDAGQTKSITYYMLQTQ